ncbi:MAG TPA: hypothetical protein ENK84_11565 [Desulfobulbus sp.]|nr:hypothetical protein [Desulfobulbus sp.]
MYKGHGASRDPFFIGFVIWQSMAGQLLFNPVPPFENHAAGFFRPVVVLRLFQDDKRPTIPYYMNKDRVANNM